MQREGLRNVLSGWHLFRAPGLEGAASFLQSVSALPPGRMSWPAAVLVLRSPREQTVPSRAAQNLAV